ncbi:hypothetical protein J2X69_003997 [Algoriphagus sp. 4150]|uniref:hypothetical protein n=1 Tax=Algoriphagus sp. 4150 TaxID=2817756 RepID=UPI002861DE61|nr:hypothetical protein [Algoriphagus sp. 4150]MDR7131633.1 hypothetical protein [Algoriphagus sp. 4150]
MPALISSSETQRIRELHQLRQLPSNAVPPPKPDPDAQGNLLPEVVIVGSMGIKLDYVEEKSKIQ